MDLIPAEALLELGKVLEYGCHKYAANNWRGGIHNSRLIAACLRHLVAFNSGVDVDDESGLSHISHALCNLAFLASNIVNRPDLDDRYKETK